MSHPWRVAPARPSLAVPARDALLCIARKIPACPKRDDLQFELLVKPL